MKGLRLAVRVFIALAGLLSVAILTTSATLLYNSGTALRDEAEIAAVHLAELISGTFAEMGEISLANVGADIGFHARRADDGPGAHCRSHGRRRRSRRIRPAPDHRDP